MQHAPKPAAYFYDSPRPAAYFWDNTSGGPGRGPDVARPAQDAGTLAQDERASTYVSTQAEGPASVEETNHGGANDSFGTSKSPLRALGLEGP